MVNTLQGVHDAALNDTHLDEGAVLAVRQHIVKQCHQNLEALDPTRAKFTSGDDIGIAKAVAKIGPCLRSELDRMRDRECATDQESKREDPHLLKCLECIRACINLLAPRLAPKTEDALQVLAPVATFLDVTNSTDVDGDTSAKLLIHIKEFQQLCESMLESDKTEAKAAEQCVGVVVRLCKLLPLTEQHRQNKWFVEMTRKDVDSCNKAVVPVLAQAMLILNRGDLEEMQTGLQLGQDIRTIIGSNSDEYEAPLT